MPEALERARQWLLHEHDRTDNFFSHAPRKGFARGIEFYSGYDLLHIMARSIGAYASKVGCWPDVITPRKQTEKLIWMKFFGYLPMPTPANKLSARNFIPPGYEDKILTATTLWRSTTPSLPPADAIPPGKYFFKSNNNTKTSFLLDFPLSAIVAPQLKDRISRMFQPPAMVSGGEWWYATMQPEIFVEDVIDVPENISEWKFQIYNGRCQFLYDRRGDHRTTDSVTFYDREFRHIPVRFMNRKIGEVLGHLPQFQLMRDAAEAIARDLLFARVDFYLTARGKVYLGEITLCPNNACQYFSEPGFDVRVGEAWDHIAQYRVD